MRMATWPIKTVWLVSSMAPTPPCLKTKPQESALWLQRNGVPFHALTVLGREGMFTMR